MLIARNIVQDVVSLTFPDCTGIIPISWLNTVVPSMSPAGSLFGFLIGNSLGLAETLKLDFFRKNLSPAAVQSRRRSGITRKK
jgi:hypothetical protein